MRFDFLVLFFVASTVLVSLSGPQTGGSEVVICDGTPATITEPTTTTVDEITFVGTSGADVIVAAAPEQFAGRVVVKALGGDDKICGSDLRDRIDAGVGADRVFAGAGRDVVYGGPGRDYINAGLGNDTVYGGAGPDRIYGARGRDWLDGRSGQDRVYGGRGTDEVRGHDDDDWTYGGPGDNDIVRGGAGNDAVFGGFGTGDECWFGPGTVHSFDLSCELVDGLPPPGA